jgi:hypothetical protein
MQSRLDSLDRSFRGQHVALDKIKDDGIFKWAMEFAFPVKGKVLGLWMG